MDEDASLDAFLGAESETNEDTSHESAVATTTYAWTDDGAACTECGEVVEQRWQQSGALVCTACKSWSQA